MFSAIYYDLLGHIHHRMSISRVPRAFARSSRFRALFSSVVNIKMDYRVDNQFETNYTLTKSCLAIIEHQAYFSTLFLSRLTQNQKRQ